ncbi:MAG: PQQ-binding-like beta-propeller repeat protein [bacterium]
MKARTIFGVLYATSALLMSGAASAQDWPHWRGPNHNGATTAKGLPEKFSPSQGVKWTVDLPGPSAATPAIVGDNIYVSSVDEKANALLALCFDRKTGKLKWRQSVGSGYRPANQGEVIRMDDRSNYASPSPIADTKRVFFFYGNGDLAAFTPGGAKLWARNIQKEYGDFAFGWTFSSSPLLYNGTLYLQILQRDEPVSGRGKNNAPSFLLALRPDTGAELWRQERKSDAHMESREAFSSPIPYTHKGRKEIIIAGGDVITGHDPSNGKELWRWGTWNEGHRETYWRLVPSPVAGAGVALVAAPKRQPVYAAKLGGNGDLGGAGLAWNSDIRGPISCDVPTPLFMDGRFYVVSDVRKAVSCVEPETGKILWTTPIPGRSACWSSPTGADGKIYSMNLDGTVFVFDAATGRLLAENPMAPDGADLRSSIAVAYNNLFIRMNDKLYCLGK